MIAMLFSKLEWIALTVFPPLLLLLLAYLDERDFFAERIAKKEAMKNLRKVKKKKRRK